MKITIDFEKINSYNDIYNQIKEQITLPAYFGNNLDALYDTLTTELKMPMHFKLINPSKEQKNTYKGFFILLNDLKNEIEGFTYSEIHKKKWNLGFIKSIFSLKK